MDIRLMNLERFIELDREERLGSAGRYRQGEPSRIIGLVGRLAGVVANWSAAVERWAGEPTGSRATGRRRAAAR